MRGLGEGTIQSGNYANRKEKPMTAPTVDWYYYRSG